MAHGYFEYEKWSELLTTSTLDLFSHFLIDFITEFAFSPFHPLKSPSKSICLYVFRFFSIMYWCLKTRNLIFMHWNDYFWKCHYLLIAHKWSKPDSLSFSHCMVLRAGNLQKGIWKRTSTEERKYLSLGDFPTVYSIVIWAKPISTGGSDDYFQPIFITRETRFFFNV